MALSEVGGIPARIVERIEEDPGGCWVWTGYLNEGYGHARFNGKKRYVHRIVYEAMHGPVPAGLELDHAKCDNKACCNPDHLEPVTHLENVQRGRAGARMREQTHCLRGHEFSKGNTKLYRGKRVCRRCINIRARASRC